MTAPTPVFIECPEPGYRMRTIRNASADATIAIAADFTTAGERLTRAAVLKQQRVYAPVRYVGAMATTRALDATVGHLNCIAKHSVTLNIAGNGIYTLRDLLASTQVDVDTYTYDLLSRIVAHPALRPKIVAVQSGGQTGFDEAGIKAAVRLHIQATVIAPKGWAFRPESGVEVRDGTKFKARFNLIG